MTDLETELEFLRIAITALEPMDAFTRGRVLNYLCSRYMPTPEESAAERKAQRTRGEP